MLKIQGEIPRKVYLGYSGGVDSAAVLDFLANNHEVVLVFVDHLNEISEQEEDFVTKAARHYYVPVLKYKIDPVKHVDHSKEEHWRNERYKVFHSLPGKVITCHHLDDCVETWVWNMCNGKARTIPYNNINVIRPFRTNRKNLLVDWCGRHKVKWFKDPTNADSSFACRNHIRLNVMPMLEQVNPGIYTTIRNMLLEEKI